ncbi:MAG: TlpA family protein disulfide reductase [Gemmatimonadetes bacterium]|nr:TlpA family protein disulfide reductase [Gemmatimonadota bacterium]
MPIRKLAAFAGLAAIVASGLVAPATVSAEETRTKVPSFQSSTVAGDKIALDDLLGKGPILIDFWATWCKPCIKELPYVQRIADEYADKGLKVLAVTIDTPRSQSQVKKFVKTRGFTFDVVLDGESDVFRKCQGKGSIPYVVILDSEGFIRYQHTGYRPGDEKELEHEVVKLLREAGVELEDPAEAAAAEAENAG